MITQLEVFLNCAAFYLFRKCRPSEFTFDSLEKFARATKREAGAKSAFDIILFEARDYALKLSIHHFEEVYSSWTTQNLTSVLRLIKEYIKGKHGPCRMRFEFRKKEK